MVDDTPDKPSSEDVLKVLYGGGKPLLFVCIALQAAAGCDEMSEMIKIFLGFKRSPRKLPPPPGPDIWRKLYRSHNRLNNRLALVTGVQAENEDDTDGEITASEVFRVWRGLIRMDTEDR